MNPALPLPRHAIAAALIVDADLHAINQPGEDVHLAWSRLSCVGDIVWTQHNGGHWIAVGGELMRAIYKDKSNFSSRSISLPVPPEPFRLSPSGDDGEEHRVARAIIMPHFAPAAIVAMTQTMRQWTRERVDALAPQGRCEFMADFASVLPVEIFLTMIDLPLADRPMLRALAEGMTRETDADKRDAAFGATVAYLGEWIDRRATNPGSDVLSAIATADFMGRPIERERALRMALNVLLGGLDSTASMTGFIIAALAGNPAARAEFRTTSAQRPQAVEELMRRHGVVNNLRTAVADFAIGGVTIGAGEYVYLVNCLHGLDPRLYANPLAIDFSRRPQPHAVFGNGDHRCAGANLARLEIGIFLDEWLTRIPDFHIPAGEAPVSRSGPVNAMVHLPLAWSTAAP